MVFRPWNPPRGLVVVALCAFLFVHCSSTPDENANNNNTNVNTNVNSNTNQPPEQRNTSQALTYHKDVRNILEKDCVGCHYKGGIGLFPLTSYEQAKTYAGAIADAVKSRRMPPYPADPKSCGQEYHDNPSLSQKEIDTIVEWVKGGATEGDVHSYKKPEDKNLNVGLSRVDLSLKMPESYIPQRMPDDYRCFLVPWPEKEKRYVSGFQIKAGNPALVHHVIAYVAKPKDINKFTEKDKNDAGVGYECYGGAGGPAEWLGAWAPGTPGRDYPEGTGILVEPGSMIIIQMHYNSLNKKPGPDQTSIDFKLEKQVERPSYLLPLSAVGRRKDENGKTVSWKIPAGQEFTHRELIDNPLTFPVTIHSVMFHMHMLGKVGRMYLKRKDDTKEESMCLLNIPKWDFNWQLAYPLKKPITVNPGDRVGIECKWDNSAANQPVVDGKRLKPRDVYWGDGSTDEMCLGVVYVSY